MPSLDSVCFDRKKKKKNQPGQRVSSFSEAKMKTGQKKKRDVKQTEGEGGEWSRNERQQQDAAAGKLTSASMTSEVEVQEV